MSTRFNEYLLPIRRTPVDWEKAQKFLDWYLFEVGNFVNSRTIGIYSTQEIPSGEQLQLSGKSYGIFRKVLDIGALPNATTSTIPHGISNVDAGFRLMDLRLCANDTTDFDYFVLSYWSIAAADIKIDIEGPNVVITTMNDYSAYDKCLVIIEYAVGVA